MRVLVVGAVKESGGKRGALKYEVLAHNTVMSSTIVTCCKTLERS